MNYSQFTLAIGLSLTSLFMTNPLLQAKPGSLNTELQIRSQQSPLIAAQPATKPGSNNSRGGSRSGCNVAKTTANQDVYALAPSNQEAFSLDANPTLWFYLPYDTATKPITARLTVQNESGRAPVYSKSISLSGAPGIVGIRLPQSLKQGTAYRWYMTIVCDANTDGASVNGWVRVVRPSGDLGKQRLPFSQQLALYKQQFIWHDRLTFVLTQLNKNPQAKTAWESLLQEIGMERLKQEPVVGAFRF